MSLKVTVRVTLRQSLESSYFELGQKPTVVDGSGGFGDGLDAHAVLRVGNGQGRDDDARDGVVECPPTDPMDRPWPPMQMPPVNVMSCGDD